MTLIAGRRRRDDHDDRQTPQAGEPGGEDSRASAGRGRSHAWKIAGTLLSVAILALSAAVLVHTLATVSLADLRAAIQEAAGPRILLAVCGAAGSYLMLTGYDFLALKQLRLRVPYRTAALASFTSYAISFTLGFPLITAGVVRYWIYSQAGIRGSKIASLTVIAGVTFWLGMALVLGLALTFDGNGLAAVDHLGREVNIAVGVGALALLAAYLVWVGRGHRRIKLMGMRLELPSLTLSLGQIVLGVADLCCASAALFVLLPPSDLNFTGFAGIYVLGCLIGMASNAPGGVGAFEATILNTVSGPSGAVLASLLMFRAIYYFGPFILALAFLGAHEVFRRWKSLREALAVVEDDENISP